MIIEGAEPFLLKGGSEGILLIHGFTGLPAELLLMGKFLNRAGYTVLGVRLAGHATNELNLMKTNNEDWFNSALDGYALLSGLCEKIFVVGHSMGALLTLKLAYFRKVEKIVTLAAPIFIDESLHLKDLPPRSECKNFAVIRPHRRLKDVPPAANKSYRKMPFISVHELIHLLIEVKMLLPKITAPILIMHGTEDHTAQPKSANFIEEKINSARKEKIFVENCGHLLPLTETRDFVFEEVLKFLNGT